VTASVDKQPHERSTLVQDLAIPIIPFLVLCIVYRQLHCLITSVFAGDQHGTRKRYIGDEASVSQLPSVLLQITLYQTPVFRVIFHLILILGSDRLGGFVGSDYSKQLSAEEPNL
jgi:hypothetical protein